MLPTINNTIIKTYLISFFCILIILSCGDQSICSLSKEEIENAIEKVARPLIPDKRTDVRDVSIEGSCPNWVIHYTTTKPESIYNVSDTLSILTEATQLKTTALPHPKLGGDTLGIINNSVANIRTKPTHSAELTTQALLGQPVKILDKKEDWYRIRTPDNYIAWIDAGGVKVLNEEEYKEITIKEKVIITSMEAFLYDSKKMNHIVSDLVLGDIVFVVSQSESGYNVMLPDGRSGYIQNQDVDKYDSFAKQEKIDFEKLKNRALQLMGRPYLWGGTSIRGMDCSGFIKTLLWDQGFIFPRDASQQVHVGNTIKIDSSLSQLREGDLIFFGNFREDGSQRITHVAIYLGNGGIIHATERVKVENLLPDHPLYNDHRRKSMLEVRRIINFEKQMKHADKMYQY